MKPSFEEYLRHTHDERPGEWPRIAYEAIQSGRSTRMANEARLLSLDQAVLVVVLNDDYAQDFKRRRFPILDSREIEQSFCLITLRNITVVSVNSLTNGHGVDWRRMRPVGLPESTAVLWGHEVLEQRFEKMLVELHRFDGKLPEGIK